MFFWDIEIYDWDFLGSLIEIDIDSSDPSSTKTSDIL